MVGHHQGATAVRNIVRASREIGIPYLTLFAFSSENWSRPPEEVEALMVLLKDYLVSELQEMLENGIRLLAVGDLAQRGPVAHVLGPSVRDCGVPAPCGEGCQATGRRPLAHRER
jgi:undecaprenyl diphosphate synthase